MHGFRSGAAVSLDLSNVRLHEIIDHVGWKTPQTALHCIQLKEVLNPAGPAANLATLDSSAFDVYTKWNELQGFSSSFFCNVSYDQFSPFWVCL